MLELIGKSVSKGIAIGKIAFYSNNNQNVPQYEIEDPEKELERYEKAMTLAKAHLQTLYDEACRRVSKKESAIFRTHIMILEDSKFVDMVRHCITVKKWNTEFAVHSTASQLAEIFRQLEDDYLRQRYSDILDAANTLLEIMRPKARAYRNSRTEPVIMAASELLPSETLRFKKEMLLGFVTNNGSKNSHTAILARMMELPAVTHITESLAEFDGRIAVLDGQKGKLLIDPDNNTLALYKAQKSRCQREQQNLKRQLGLPCVTKNGRPVRLSAVLSDLEDIAAAENNEAQGIGLFRSEYAFINRKQPPSEEEQLEVYKTVIKPFHNTFTTICTANLSAGKGIGYLDLPQENNPAMGYKGIRVSLSNTELLKTQLSAIYRASAYGKVRIVLPMVNSVDEVEYVKRLTKEVKAALRLKGIACDSTVPLGVLIETPAAAVIADDLAKATDFLMIDTNSLTQTTLAMDRENPKLEYFYEPYHKAVLRLIRDVCRVNKPVSICGELACDTYMTPLLLALGAAELAVVPSKLLAVKAVIRETDTDTDTKLLSKLSTR